MYSERSEVLIRFNLVVVRGHFWTSGSILQWFCFLVHASRVAKIL